MSLSSSQLDALSELAKARNFSKAAKNLAITQSALSQRIANLEKELGTSLLVRESRGIRFTASGEKLLRYCQLRAELEAECLAGIVGPGSSRLSGVIRLGGYSTIMRSVLLPSIGSLVAANPNVRMEVFTREMGELAALLRSGEADFIFLDGPAESDGVESRLLGHEENVLIEPKAGKVVENVFLDHDQDDQTTYRFFAVQRQRPKSLKRSFLDEIYGIIDGVAAGTGRAVVPLHLVRHDRRLRIVPDLKPLLLPVYLHYYRQPFYTELQKRTIQCLTEGVSARLLP